MAEDCVAGGVSDLGLEEALAVRPPDVVDVLLAGDPVGEAVMVAFEWPNSDGTGLDSFEAEPPFQWPEAVRSKKGLAVLIPSPVRPLSIEHWFYVDRDPQGIPAGEPSRKKSCLDGALDKCGMYDAVEGVLSVRVPSVGKAGLFIVQVEWPTPPSEGSGVVARASWAVELAP